MKKLQEYTLYALLLTLPFSLRKIVFLEPFLGAGVFSEYTDASIWLFDIFLFVYMAIFILNNKNIQLSSILTIVPRGTVRDLYKNIQCSTWNNCKTRDKDKMFHVEHGFILVFFSIFLVNQSDLGLYIFLKWVFYLLGATIIYLDVKKMFHVEQLQNKKQEQIVPRGTISQNIETKKCSTWNNIVFIFKLNLAIQLIIVIIQVYTQKSIGLWFLGEPVLSINIDGVATILIAGKEFLRGYGTFLHPNILAGFAVCTSILLFYNMFHVEQLQNKRTGQYVPRGTIAKQENRTVCSTWNKYGWLIVSGILIFLSFSKSGILALLIPGIVFVVPRGTFSHLYKNIQCSTWNNRMLLRGIFLLAGALACIIYIMQYIYYNVNIYYLIQQPLQERFLQYQSVHTLGVWDWIKGVGLGGYLPFLAKQGFYSESWQYQPVHNVFLLSVIELGVVVAGLLWARFLIFSLQHKQYVYGLLPIIPLGFLDHYFWDMEQMQFLLLVVVGLSFLLFTERHKEY